MNSTQFNHLLWWLNKTGLWTKANISRVIQFNEWSMNYFEWISDHCYLFKRLFVQRILGAKRIWLQIPILWRTHTQMYHPSKVVKGITKHLIKEKTKIYLLTWMELYQCRITVFIPSNTSIFGCVVINWKLKMEAKQFIATFVWTIDDKMFVNNNEYKW